MVVTRMRDTAFKRVLSTMPSGAKVKLEGPFGNLILHNNVARAAVILAGGIGITPFRSMVFQAHEKLPHGIYLFYSNRRPEDAAFLGELETLEKQNYRFPTMTSIEKSHRAWNGETGRITKHMLSRHSNDAQSPIYYPSGPPGMVRGFTRCCMSPESMTMTSVRRNLAATEARPFAALSVTQRSARIAFPEVIPKNPKADGIFEPALLQVRRSLFCVAYRVPAR